MTAMQVLLLLSFVVVNTCAASHTTLSSTVSTTAGPSRIGSRRSARVNQQRQVQLCASNSITKNLMRGAFLRVASDLTGGTPLEAIKTRVAATRDGPIQALNYIYKSDYGIRAFWAGSSSRSIEGALLGAMFMVGSVTTKNQLLRLGAPKTTAALAGGLVGGLVQALVMTPAGLVFTSLNLNRNRKGYENDNALSVTKRMLKQDGIRGMYYGILPMSTRQATNWMSRSYLTEVARSTFKMSKYGLLGEIGSGILGGLGSTWNTPIETIRVYTQADVSAGRAPKSMGQYWTCIVEEQGYQGLFRGITPRSVQAIWQTCFMVVVPNLLGV